MEGVFHSLALVLGLAAVGGILTRMLKQPAMMGYIAAGLILSAIGVTEVLEIGGMVEIMGQLGVTLLLFLAGMELPIPELKKMGRVALIAGLSQVAISSVLGYGVATAVGITGNTAVFTGIGMAFGSTILIVKLLSEKGDLQSLHGKIAIGYLLVQDFVAVGLLVMMAGFGNGEANPVQFGITALKGLMLIGLALWLSEAVMTRAMNYLSRSTELVFIGAIGWCLLVASAVSSPWVGFTVEIGGLLAGLSLAGAAEQGQIISRVKPLRDFFLTWFFVALGAGIHFGNLGNSLFQAVLISSFVLVVNPIIVMMILGRMGYRKRTMFLASFAVSQISEFSLIMLTGAVRYGQAKPEILSTMTLVAIITMIVSTYMIWYGDTLYKHIHWLPGLFEKKTKGKKDEEPRRLSGHIVLFGHNRVGKVLLPALLKLGVPVVVVDFNPEVVHALVARDRNTDLEVMYGDMSDHELYERLALSDAKLIVSTVPDMRDSQHLLQEIRRFPHRPLTVMTAQDGYDAERLYTAGADYVLEPYSVGGEFLAHVFATQGVARDIFKEFGKKHLAKLHA